MQGTRWPETRAVRTRLLPVRERCAAAHRLIGLRRSGLRAGRARLRGKAQPRGRGRRRGAPARRARAAQRRRLQQAHAGAALRAAVAAAVAARRVPGDQAPRVRVHAETGAGRAAGARGAPAARRRGAALRVQPRVGLGARRRARGGAEGERARRRGRGARWSAGAPRGRPRRARPEGRQVAGGRGGHAEVQARPDGRPLRHIGRVAVEGRLVHDRREARRLQGRVQLLLRAGGGLAAQAMSRAQLAKRRRPTVSPHTRLRRPSCMTGCTALSFLLQCRGAFCMCCMQSAGWSPLP